MPNHDFGNIIAAEFKKATKGKKNARLVLNIRNAGGVKMRLKVIAAGPDSFSAYVGNQASEGFSESAEVFNPDMVVSYEVAK